MGRQYKTLQEELSKLEEEIFQIKQNLSKAIKFRENKEYQEALGKLRIVLEGIAQNIYRIEKPIDAPFLELRKLIKELEKDGLIPKNIMPPVRTVQTFGNEAMHNTKTPYNDSHVQPAFTSIEIVFNWFINEYHSIPYTDAIEKNELAVSLIHPYYKEDLNKKKPWNSENYVSDCSILIVLGSHTACELLDRYPAELLKMEIERQGNYDQKKRVLIVSDSWYLRDDELEGKKIISFGTKRRNDVAYYMRSHGSIKELPNFSDSKCKVYSNTDGFVFETKIPGGTLESVKKFISSDNGLKKFLEQIWKKEN